MEERKRPGLQVHGAEMLRIHSEGRCLGMRQFLALGVFPELLKGEASHKQDSWLGDGLDIRCGEGQELKKQKRKHRVKGKAAVGRCPESL